MTAVGGGSQVCVEVRKVAEDLNKRNPMSAAELSLKSLIYSSFEGKDHKVRRVCDQDWPGTLSPS